jgi:hypothetical protein
VFQFTQLQLTVARALGIEPGRYTHGAWSLHIYEEHATLAERLVEPSQVVPFGPTGFGTHDDGWDRCRVNAHAVLMGESPAVPTLSEEWYVEQLRPYFSATR